MFATKTLATVPGSVKARAAEERARANTAFPQAMTHCRAKMLPEMTVLRCNSRATDRTCLYRMRANAVGLLPGKLDRGDAFVR